MSKPSIVPVKRPRRWEHLNQLVRDYLHNLAGDDNPEKSIEEFKELSGKGNSRGWTFNRDEIHERS